MTERPAAHVLQDESSEALAGCGTAMLVVAAGGLALALRSSSTLWSAVLGLFVLLALGALAWVLLEMRRWEPLELHFSQWPLHLGSETTVRIVRRARQAVADADHTLDAELVCKESATYTVGTDTRTDTDVVHREQTRVVGELRQRTFVAEFPLRIPHDRGAPTFDLGDNSIEWKLDIDVNELSRLMATMAFTLEVGPVLDRRHRNIQDAAEST